MVDKLNTSILNRRKNKKLAIAIYVFLVRLYHYDNDRLEQVERELLEDYQQTLTDLHVAFYAAFQKGFCKAKQKMRPTINVHSFLHLEESRKRTGPLHTTSTEPFESLYARLSRCYKPGTKNTGKQLMENFYLHNK